MVNSPPQIMGLAIDFHEHLIKMPLPIRMIGNWVHPFFADLTLEHWAKFIPSVTNGLVTNIDTSLVE